MQATSSPDTFACAELVEKPTEAARVGDKVGRVRAAIARESKRAHDMRDRGRWSQ